MCSESRDELGVLQPVARFPCAVPGRRSTEQMLLSQENVQLVRDRIRYTDKPMWFFFCSYICIYIIGKLVFPQTCSHIILSPADPRWRRLISLIKRLHLGSAGESFTDSVYVKLALCIYFQISSSI